MKTERSRMIAREHTENLMLLTVLHSNYCFQGKNGGLWKDLPNAIVQKTLRKKRFGMMQMMHTNCLKQETYVWIYANTS